MKKPSNKRYAYSDKVMEYLIERFIEEFEKYQNQLSFDKLNIISRTRTLYQKLDNLTRSGAIRVSRKAYDDIFRLYFDNAPHKKLSSAYANSILDDYDPITYYVYTHEVDRKCARLSEGIEASRTKPERIKRIDISKRQWTDMSRQYVDEIAENSAIQAMIDNGVKHVRWVTAHDEKRCKVCAARDGKIYGVRSVPKKPHWRCRCYVVPFD